MTALCRRYRAGKVGHGDSKVKRIANKKTTGKTSMTSWIVGCFVSERESDSMS